MLDDHQHIGSCTGQGDVCIADITVEMKASEMKEYLIENGVSAYHLVKRKPSLEQQFLDLTNNQ